MPRSAVKLNQNLDPSRFVVCLSTDSALLLDDYRGECENHCKGRRTSGDGECARCKLRAYLRSLGLHLSEPAKDAKPPKYFRLCGRYAVEHARRVHQKIRRQLLRFDQVTAVDVGFAIHESEHQFENVLAIRIHVQSKKSADALQQEGLPVFTDLRYLGFKGAGPSKHAVASTGTRDSAEGTDAGRWLPRNYPIAGVTAGDLSAYCYKRGESPSTCGDIYKDWCHCGHCCEHLCKRCWLCCVCCKCHLLGTLLKRLCAHCESEERLRCRLAICGVPLDVVRASYFPSVGHPGGDFDEGVFVDRIGTTNDLTDSENLLTGRGRVSPLVGGISVGSVNGRAGTLSAIVWDETDGSACVLANWHVLAGSNRAKAGQVCYQPAIFDGGGTDDVIGHLKRWHIGELGDAALAELDGSRFFASGEVLGLWHPIAGYRRPELNLEIRKWGRTTGFTEGFIDGIQLSTHLEYGEDQVRHFEHQFHISPLYPAKDVSQPGDSGALVFASYDLDDLEVIATGILQEGCPLLKELCDSLGFPPNSKDGAERPIESIEELAEAIRRLLARGEASCVGPLVTSRPPSEPEFGSIIQLMQSAGGARVGSEARASSGGKKAGSGAGGKANGDDEARLEDFKHLLSLVLEEFGFDLTVAKATKEVKDHRRARNVYYAVGMIFAGDTPGSPFGEFALASDISLLAEDLRFSLRPVFEPRSSFRRLRKRAGRLDEAYGRRQRRGAAGPDREPGAQGADPRGGGPQPDGETLQSTGPGQSGGG